jgi:hypothetical protein
MDFRNRVLEGRGVPNREFSDHQLRVQAEADLFSSIPKIIFLCRHLPPSFLSEYSMNFVRLKFDDFVKSQKSRRSREGGSPELLDLTGFPLSRE